MHPVGQATAGAAAATQRAQHRSAGMAPAPGVMQGQLAELQQLIDTRQEGIGLAMGTAGHQAPPAGREGLG